MRRPTPPSWSAAFLLVLAPRVLNVQRPFDLIFQLGINLAIWGNVLALFDHIYGYDKLVHFILPCGSAMLLYITLCHLRIVPDLSEDAGLHDRVAMVLVTLAFGLSVGGIFEMWEWFSNTAFGTEMFVTYGDSIGDLIDDTLGALMGGVDPALLDRARLGHLAHARRRPARRGADADRPAGPRRATCSRASAIAWRGCGRRGGTPTSRDGRTRTLPRWLAGDWGPVLRDPVDLIRLSLLAGALVAAVQGDLEHAARFLFGLGLSVLVRLAEAPRPFDAALRAGDGVPGVGRVQRRLRLGRRLRGDRARSLVLAVDRGDALPAARPDPRRPGPVRQERHPRADGHPADRDLPRLRRRDALRGRGVGVQRPLRRARRSPSTS